MTLHALPALACDVHGCHRKGRHSHADPAATDIGRVVFLMLRRVEIERLVNLRPLLAMEICCPRCNAAPGERCHRRGRLFPHDARERAANAEREREARRREGESP